MLASRIPLNHHLQVSGHKKINAGKNLESSQSWVGAIPAESPLSQVGRAPPPPKGFQGQHLSQKQLSTSSKFFVVYLLNHTPHLCPFPFLPVSVVEKSWMTASGIIAKHKKLFGQEQDSNLRDYSGNLSLKQWKKFWLSSSIHSAFPRRIPMWFGGLSRAGSETHKPRVGLWYFSDCSCQ